MVWRQRLVVVVLAIIMAGLAAAAMGLILLHTRPLTADSIEAPNIN